MGEKSAHKKKKSGKKASKKKAAAEKKKKGGSLTDGDGGADLAQMRQRNPKAFINASRGRAKVQRARTADKEQKRMHGARELCCLLCCVSTTSHLHRKAPLMHLLHELALPIEKM